MAKKRRYCPYCRQKDYLIERLESQIQTYEIKRIKTKYDQSQLTKRAAEQS
jgi:hypothetical protein